MMRRQLTELHEREREPVAALWASEGSIYGRFGYGVAARQVGMTGDKTRMRLRPGTPVGYRPGRARLPGAGAAARGRRCTSRSGRRRSASWGGRSAWWDRILYDGEHIRGGATARRHALYTEQDGTVTGFVTYRLKEEWTPGRNDSEVRVADLFATTPAAYAALWAYVASIDLIPSCGRTGRRWTTRCSTCCADARALRAEVYDSLWVRLADVGRALAERGY